MRRAVLSLALLMCVASAHAAASAAPRDGHTTTSAYRKFDPATSSRPRWVDGEILVRFHPGLGKAARRGVQPVRGARVSDRIPNSGVTVVALPSGVGVGRALRAYRDDPRVLTAEPNHIVYMTETIPNDPRFDDQWALRNVGQPHPLSDSGPGTAPPTGGKFDADIDASEAWDRQQGIPTTVVAVVDSGVDVEHPDLDGNIWTNPGEVPTPNGIDDDRNGYIDDINGWDFADNDRSLLESGSYAGKAHGTHVAGIVAAETNNTTGIAGVCPRCSIMVLKFMSPTDTNGDGAPDTMTGTLRAELEAFAYARSEGADVVNGSFSSALWSSLEREGVARLGRAGVFPVFAAGNSALDNDMLLEADFTGDGVPDGFSPEYPASYTLPAILSVTASNHNDEYGYSTECYLAGFSKAACAFANWGHDSVDLAAPGTDILSTFTGDAYRTFDGTSMAAPHAAGVAGLILSRHPTYGPLQLKNAIMNSSQRPDSLTVLHAQRPRASHGKFTRTSGRLNARRALDGSTAPATPMTDGNVNGARSIFKRRSDAVVWPGDVNDVYKKRLRKGRRYKVVLNGPDGSDFDLVVWRPGTKEIWQLERGCYGAGACKMLRYQATQSADEQATFRAASSRVHYFQVSAWLFERGRYTLRIRRI